MVKAEEWGREEGELGGGGGGGGRGGAAAALDLASRGGGGPSRDADWLGESPPSHQRSWGVGPVGPALSSCEQDMAARTRRGD